MSKIVRNNTHTYLTLMIILQYVYFHFTVTYLELKFSTTSRCSTNLKSTLKWNITQGLFTSWTTKLLRVIWLFFHGHTSWSKFHGLISTKHIFWNIYGHSLGVIRLWTTKMTMHQKVDVLHFLIYVKKTILKFIFFVFDPLLLFTCSLFTTIPFG